MISLCMVIYNEKKTLNKTIQSAKEIVNEIVIIDQSSTDGTFELAKEFGDIVIQKSFKGNADPDREYCASLARGEWILFLDADEYLSDKLKKKIPKLAQDKFLDVFWIEFENLMDGINIESILGKDYHPRLYKKGAVQWLPDAHTHPKILSPLQGWIEDPIIHDRKWDKTKSVHSLRGQFIGAEKKKIEEDFLKKVEEYLGSHKG